MIIGLCGLAGAGKSTVARMLADEFGFVVLPFAGPLKAMTRALGLSAREMAGDLKEAPCAALCGKTPRQFMQLLGTEFGRQMIGENFWVETWRRTVDDARLAQIADAGELCPPRIVSDDVRFGNEAGAVHALGGVVIRIERPGAGSASGAGHASEALDFPVDGVFTNAGDLSALLANVREHVAAALALEAYTARRP